jgi:hypothetical protein
MKCEGYEELLVGWMDDSLTAAERTKVEGHLTECAACREELAVMQRTWDIMGEIKAPEPSVNMQANFNALLKDFKQAEEAKKGFWSGLKEQLSSLWSLQPRLPLAYSLVLVLICFGAGYWFVNNGKQEEQMNELSAQVHDLKQTMMLALLDNPSASERMRAVSYTDEIKHVDNRVVEALLQTLNNDPNVNVRLTTLDALAKLANHPEVRQGLIQSINQQDSPLMQSAIADVMLKLQEKQSVKEFKELLKQKHLDNGVRTKISQTINSLI